MKSMGNIGGAFKFVCEIYFNPLFFVRWLVPLIFKKIHFGTKLYFLYFLFFFIGGERGVAGFIWRERELFVDDDYDH